jgi:Mg-chelatase subunit ChlD
MLLIVSFSTAFAAESSSVGVEKTGDSNKYNIVFVVDNSGSTKDSDPDLNRSEAIAYFLSVMTNNNNKVGGIVFNDQMRTSDDVLLAIESVEDKKRIQNFFDLPQVVGGTDIGTALLTATQMLDVSKTPGIPGVIILMTDGTTAELGEEGMRRAEVNQQEALDIAVKNEYPVYCVGLNADGRVDSGVLQSIADVTHGQYREVSTSTDLTAVYAMFYDLLYGTVSDSNTVQGAFDKRFYVPAIGVEDVNISIVTSEPLKYLDIYKPTGIALTQEEKDALVTIGQRFMTIKIEDLLRGEWRVSGEGADNTDVTIQIRQNYNLSVVGATKKKTRDHNANSEVPFVAQILLGNQVIADKEAYEDYEATALFTNSMSDDVLAIPMENAGTKYICNLPLGDVGEIYYVTVELKNDYFQIKSDSVEIRAVTPILDVIKENIPPWTLPVTIGVVLFLLAVVAALFLLRHFRSRSQVTINITIRGIDEDINDPIILSSVNKFQFTLRELLSRFALEIGHGRTGEENRRVLEQLLNNNSAKLDGYIFRTDTKDAKKFYFWKMNEKTRNRYDASSFRKTISLSGSAAGSFRLDRSEIALDMTGVPEGGADSGEDFEAWDQQSQPDDDFGWDNTEWDEERNF